MAFKPLTESFQKLSERLEDFVISTAEFYKLRLFKSTMKGAVSLVNLLVYGSLFLFVLLFLSFGVALWLGSYFENSFIGFFLVGGIYGVILLFMFIYGRKIIERKMLIMFSGLVYDEDDVEPKERAEMEILEYEESLREDEFEKY